MDETSKENPEQITSAIPTIRRTLTCGHVVTRTMKKRVTWCDSCKTLRRPIAALDE